MNPMSDLLKTAFEQGLLTIEHRPELHGAEDTVPSKVILYVTIGMARWRLAEVDARPYILDRMAPPHARLA